MTCLGGTREDPRPWIRLGPDGEREGLRGRFACNVATPRTIRRLCSFCPAYRGRRADGSIATGLAPDGTPYALRPAELAAYDAALDAALDDDFSLLQAWEDRMATGVGDQALRMIGDPDALDRRAAYMRRWRQGRPDPTNAERQRRWRQRQREREAGHA